MGRRNEDKVKMKSSEMSIIIYSCWKNRDMWEIFSVLLKKYWSNCEYKVVLVTDKCLKKDKKYIFDTIVEIDDTWGRMIKKALQVADTPYVMLWMDDYLLCDYVFNDDIEKQLNRAKQYHSANLRLTESPKCQGVYKKQQGIGYYKRGEAYSLSTQVGIWNVEFLRKIIKDEWSAWDYERIGSLSKECPEQPILVSLDYEFPYEEGVRQGKWMVQGAKLCRRNGIKIDTNVRPIMSNKDMARIYFKGAILDLNPTLVVKVQNIVSRIRGK